MARDFLTSEHGLRRFLMRGEGALEFNISGVGLAKLLQNDADVHAWFWVPGRLFVPRCMEDVFNNALKELQTLWPGKGKFPVGHGKSLTSWRLVTAAYRECYVALDRGAELPVGLRPPTSEVPDGAEATWRSVALERHAQHEVHETKRRNKASIERWRERASATVFDCACGRPEHKAVNKIRTKDWIQCASCDNCIVAECLDALRNNSAAAAADAASAAAAASAPAADAAWTCGACAKAACEAACFGSFLCDANRGACGAPPDE